MPRMTFEEREQQVLAAFHQFDPNGSDQTVWGCWDGRVFYVRAKRGGVITRFGNCDRAKLYELTPSGWKLHTVKDPLAKNDTCDLCGLVGVVDAWRGQAHYYRMRDAWRWVRVRGKIASPPRMLFLCPGCVTREGY